MVEEAQEQKAPIERLLNRFAKFYTPTAIILGGLLWWISGDVMRAITMLIVFCPCVMVLATPTALVASIGNAALRGSLVKKGATIESLAKINTVAFHKTGTLTMSQPKLIEVVSLRSELEGRDLLQMAAVAEKFSEHPVGRAVVQAAEARGLVVNDPDKFEVLPGLGVRANSSNYSLLLGRIKLMAEQGITITSEIEAKAQAYAAPGRSVILMANGLEVSGMRDAGV